ncbi:TPA: response regulator [Legionella anisa]
MTILDSRPTCFHHPIKVIFLDDSRSFLDALDLEFGAQLNMLTLTNPDTAIQTIDNHSQNITKSVFKMMNDVDTDTTTDRVIGFEVGNMLSIIYDKTRFDHVAILVVDYEMPNINGIEFCQKLKERKIFRIMLTAEADKDTAIKAFNNGLIDKFILKTNAELYSEITLAVQELTQRYFKELSGGIISEHASSIGDLLDNKSYLQLFAEVVSKVQPVEYYLVDTSGSFVFLDKDANPTWLIVKHNNELDEQLELLQGYEVPEQIIESVAKKEKLLFLLSVHILPQNEHSF